MPHGSIPRERPAPFLLLLLAVVLPWAAPAGLGAQDVTLSRATPEEAGMSSAVLDAGVQLFRDAVERGDLVGAVLLVAREGKVVLHEAVGWRNQAKGLRMEPNTMFRMASNTKPTIATAISMLVEEGELAWEDPVRKHIPTFDNYRAGFIRIEHLLNHTSGMRINTLFLEPLLEPDAEHPDAPSLQLEVARFGEVGAEVLPGTSYAYSNPGYNTLGALVEIGSGKSLERFLRERIYTPLGMVDSYNHEVAEKLDGKLERMGAVYYRKEGGSWVAGWEPGDAPQMPFVRASGGMISTAWDYAIFCQMFLNGGVYGGERLLERETVKRMTSPTFPTSDDGTSFYGCGWAVTDDDSFAHSGSDGTFAWVSPELGSIVLVLTQTPDGDNPRAKFVELVRMAITDDPAGS